MMSPPSTVSITAGWHDEAMLDRSLEAVTDVLATTPHVMFSIKSIDGRYLSANLAFAERAGLMGAGDVVGRTAHELFPGELAEQYEQQDQAVIETGYILSNELELITRPDRSVGWFLTSKSRWTNSAGKPAGVVCVSVDLRTAVEVARYRFADRLEVSDLADAAGMSVAQLERAARRVLGLTPKQLVMRFRIEEGLRLVTTTNMALTSVATACGYYDQSAFSRHFRRVVGASPAAYRAAHHLS
jgi:PAS domain S-box-containing protein